MTISEFYENFIKYEADDLEKFRQQKIIDENKTKSAFKICWGLIIPILLVIDCFKYTIFLDMFANITIITLTLIPLLFLICDIKKGDYIEKVKTNVIIKLFKNCYNDINYVPNLKFSKKELKQIPSFINFAKKKRNDFFEITYNDDLIKISDIDCHASYGSISAINTNDVSEINTSVLNNKQIYNVRYLGTLLELNTKEPVDYFIGIISKTLKINSDNLIKTNNDQFNDNFYIYNNCNKNQINISDDFKKLLLNIESKYNINLKLFVKYDKIYMYIQDHTIISEDIINDDKIDEGFFKKIDDNILFIKSIINELEKLKEFI